MARTDSLYNSRFSVSGSSWWDKTTDASSWTSPAAMMGQAPDIDDPANLFSVYRNLSAVANNVLYWVGTVAGIQTLFSFDGTTQTTLSTFPDAAATQANQCHSVCEFQGAICILMGYPSGDNLTYMWNPETNTLSSFGGESVVNPGAGGHLISALGLLWQMKTVGPTTTPSGCKLWRTDPRTSANWTLDTSLPDNVGYTGGIEYKGSLFVGTRTATTSSVLSKNSVTGFFGTRVSVFHSSSATDGFYRFLADEFNSVLLAYRTDLSTVALVYASATGLTGWTQEANLASAPTSIDPTALVAQGAVFQDHQYLAYAGASGFLLKRTSGVWSTVHAGPIGIALAGISEPTPPSTARPFSLIQAGGKLYGLTLSGDFSKEIALPSGVTLSSTLRVRYAVLSRKIVLSGAALSEPIWINPKTLLAYHLRGTTPSAPVLTGGAAATALYGWVTFIHKIDGVLVNESALSDPSIQSTSKIFTSIATPPGGSDWTGRRLYRSVANGTIPFQAVDIDDTTTTTFDTNSITDADLQLNPSDPELGAAPSDSDLVVSWRDRMWMRSGTAGQQDNTYFTAVGLYYAWAPDNFLLAQPVGEDFYGITGWLPRRDELGVCKRSRILKIIGTGIDADFDVVIVADGIGCISPDSCIVIRDIGYFLGVDGPYTFGPQGVEPIFDKRTTPWFQTDTYFNRSLFSKAVGGYNSVNDTYDLHLAAAGSTILNRWISYDIKRQEWLGPHRTEKFTPTGRGMLRNEDTQYLPSIGGNDGFIYRMNQLGASDEDTAILTDWILNWLHGNAPDIEHRWLQATVFVKIQESATGTVTLTARVGGLDAPDSDPIEIPMTTDRTRTPRFGAGRLLRLQFTHSTDGEDVLVEALEIPFNEIGRR